MGGEDRSKHWHPAAPGAAGTSRGVRQPQPPRYRGLSFPAPPACAGPSSRRTARLSSKAPCSRSRGSRSVAVLGPSQYGLGGVQPPTEQNRTGPRRPSGTPRPQRLTPGRSAALAQRLDRGGEGGGADERPGGPLPSCRGCSALP